MTAAPSFGDGDQPQRIEPTALEAIQRAEIDIQIATAKRYPRTLSKVKQDMMSFATLDQETAESCFYSMPRGDRNIQGPSVRLAEIAVSCYGNLRAGTRVISTTSDGVTPHVVVQAVCHDLEKNIAVTMEKRRRITKKKKNAYVDEDDINLATNACAAIAFRDAVFKVVPLALVKPVYEQAKMVAIGDAKTLVDRRARMIEAFGKMGVSLAMILAKLEKKTLDDVDLADIGTLIGLHTALRDGDTTIDEIFNPPKAAKPTFEPHPNIPTGAPSPVAEAIGNAIVKRIIGDIVDGDHHTVRHDEAIAPMPEPKPQPVPEPAPEPKKPSVRAATRAPVAEPPGPKETIMSANVPFDDFTDWMKTTGRDPNAKSWLTYDDVPEQVWNALKKDAIGVGKCTLLYGQSATVQHPEGGAQ